MNATLAQIYLNSIKSQVEYAQDSLNRIKNNPNSQLNINDEIIVNNAIKTIKEDCDDIQKLNKNKK